MNKINMRKIASFLTITFLISWGAWGVIIITNSFELLKYGSLGWTILFIVGGNGAPIASYILLKKTGEIGGFKDFFNRFFRFKSKVSNYAVVLFLLFIHFIIPIVLGSAKQEMAIYYGIILIPMTIVGGGLEEIGWRGIMQPTLEEDFSFIKATIIVAIVWGGWHLPLWFIAGTYQASISFIMFYVMALGLSFSLAIIRKVTNNVFLCILFHGYINSFMMVFILKQDISTFITVMVEMILAILIANQYKNFTSLKSIHEN